ncbi:MAG: hypothetical protein IMF09_08945 [Proteobacteria bacterium]|nr:hypothetical protein [Pseudomonadota bacterium]
MHRANTGWQESKIAGFTITLFICLLLVPVAIAAPAPGDLVIPRVEGAEMGVDITPASIFPHWVHRARYRCDACHDDLFKMKLGETEISKALMKQELSCAVCHNGKVAFDIGLNTCNRCHRTPEE